MVEEFTRFESILQQETSLALASGMDDILPEFSFPMQQVVLHRIDSLIRNAQTRAIQSFRKQLGASAQPQPRASTTTGSSSSLAQPEAVQIVDGFLASIQNPSLGCELDLDDLARPLTESELQELIDSMDREPLETVEAEEAGQKVVEAGEQEQGRNPAAWGLSRPYSSMLDI